jgi:hypothetical protein
MLGGMKFLIIPCLAFCSCTIDDHYYPQGGGYYEYCPLGYTFKRVNDYKYPFCWKNQYWTDQAYLKEYNKDYEYILDK